MTITHRYTERTSGASPRATVRYRTPIGMLTIARHNRHAGALTLTIAAGRARGTHTDTPIDARDLYAALDEQRAVCREMLERYDLARIEIYAPASHGGHMVDEITVDE